MDPATRGAEFVGNDEPDLVADSWPSDGPLQDRNLLAKGEVLGYEHGTDDKECSNEGEKDPHDVHPEGSVALVNPSWWAEERTGGFAVSPVVSSRTEFSGGTAFSSRPETEGNGGVRRDAYETSAVYCPFFQPVKEIRHIGPRLADSLFPVLLAQRCFRNEVLVTTA